ncbi:MAG: tetratricopeptide repeat protein [Planctomycetaceae bacterium]
MRRTRPRRSRIACAALFATIVANMSLPIALAAPDDDYQVAVESYRRKDWDAAVSSFRRFLAAAPRDHARMPLARLYLGLTLFNQQNYKDARETFRSWVKDYPESRNLGDTMYRLAECSYRLDDLPAAETEFAAFVDKFPQHEFHEWALPYLGDAQLRQGKTDAAAETFRRSLSKHPQGAMSEDAKFGLALAREAQNQPDAAITLYRELASNPSGERAGEAQLKLATRLFDLGRFDEAAKSYDELETKFPGHRYVSLSRLNGGFSWYRLGDYRKAHDRFAEAEKDKELAVSAAYWKGLSLKAAGNYREAADALAAAADLDSPQKTKELSGEIAFHWADSELRAGNPDAARTRFLVVADDMRDHALADDALHLAAELTLQQGDLAAAQALVARFPKEHPQSPLAVQHALLAGRVLDSRGEKSTEEKERTALYEQAVAEFGKALSTAKQSQHTALARFHLARTHSKLGRHEQVLEAAAPLASELREGKASVEYADVLILHADSLLSLSKWDEAAAAASDYLKLRPESDQVPQALSQKAIAEARAGKTAASDESLAELGKRSPDDALLPRTTYRIAEIAYEADAWDRAAGLFRKVVDAESPAFAAEALSGLGWSQYRQGQFAEAASAFGRVVDEHAQSELGPEAAFMRGLSLESAGRTEPAAEAYARTFDKLAPESAAPKEAEREGSGRYAYQSGLQAARMLHKLGKIDEADKAYERVLAKFPEAADLDKRLNEWAVINYEAERFERSDEIFRRLVRESPESDLADNARLSLAESDRIAGKSDAARKVFEALRADAASDAEVREVATYHLIGIAVEAEDWKAVRELAQALAKTFPASRYRHFARFHEGEAALDLGDLDAALAAFRKLYDERQAAELASATWLPRLWVLLAETYFKQKKYAEVARTVEEMRKERPQSELLHQADDVLGRALKQQAKFDEARAVFARVVESAAGRRTKTAARSQFFIAETYLIEQQYREARDEYLKVVLLYDFPEWQAPALLQAAKCEEQLGNWPQAVLKYEELLKKFPTSEHAAKAREPLEAARKRAGA